MAAQAEAIKQTPFTHQNITPHNKEVYGSSLRSIRTMGRLAVVGALEAPEFVQATAETFGDFYTALGENLATDKVYGEKLYFDPLEARTIADGHVVDKFGTPMYQIVEAGYEASLDASLHDEDPIKRQEMPVQVERDAGDVIAVHEVDGLGVGEMLALFSVDPKDEIRRNREFWEDKMYYREGMAVLQVYYRRSEGELLAGNYSVKQSDVAAIRALLQEEGTEVPEDTSCNQYSRHHIRKTVSEAEAQAYGGQMLARHQAKIGSSVTMRSVTQYLYQNQQTIQQHFDTFMRPLTEATASGDNHPVLQTLAQSLLQRAGNTDANERRMLMHVANSAKFSEDDARGMEDKIRYALVEELRKGLRAYLQGDAKPRAVDGEPYQAAPLYAATPMMPAVVRAGQDMFMVQMLSEQAARNIETGQAAGRSYGGCQGAGGKGNGSPESSATEKPAESQTVFGGAEARADTDDSGEDGECEYSGTFCYCCPYDSDGTPLQSPVEITAKRDKYGTAACQRTGCGATLDKNGQGSKGKIYARAMALKARKFEPVDDAKTTQPKDDKKDTKDKAA